MSEDRSWKESTRALAFVLRLEVFLATGTRVRMKCAAVYNPEPIGMEWTSAK